MRNHTPILDGAEPVRLPPRLQHQAELLAVALLLVTRSARRLLPHLKRRYKTVWVSGNFDCPVCGDGFDGSCSLCGMWKIVDSLVGRQSREGGGEPPAQFAAEVLATLPPFDVQQRLALLEKYHGSLFCCPENPSARGSTVDLSTIQPQEKHR